MYNLVLTFFVVVSTSCSLTAQTSTWQPSEGHTQIPIWPKAPPDSTPISGPEKVTTKESLIAGKPWLAVENVSQPTITVYSPKDKNTGAAVVVFPGGGYKVLAIDLEGTEIADWLTSRGLTCVLMKYRVPFSGPYWDEKSDSRVYPKVPMALQDAQRAMGLVRHRASEWQIDPHKIGVLGFSAGGHVVAGISTHFEKRLYSAVDAADEVSCRPDFAVAIYPGHLWVNEDRDDRDTLTNEKYELRPDIKITRETPPTFLLQAEDDYVDGINQTLVYYIALKNAKVPVEMHLYAEGGHAFGLRHTKFPITDWPKLVETWLRTLQMTSK